MVKTTGNYSPKDIDVVHVAEADIITREMITDPVHLMQYDKRFQILEVKLWKSGEEYAIPANTVVSIRYQKPDHTYVYNPALGVSQDRKIAYFEVSQEMTTVYGNAVFIVEIVTTDDKTLGSARIDALIDRNPVQEDGVESSSEFKTLVGYVTDAENSMNAAKVSETNAKASEVAAKDSETKAKVSETNAKASEVAAKDSETKAKVSETNAKASEVAAKNSETKAKTSETNAKASEVAAKNSETKAKTSEDNALASERKAKTSEDNAKTSEINAANSKNAAANSATAAAGSAYDAAQSAAEALASQNAAKTSETKALASEQNAKKSETNAGASAAAALASQNAAKTSETKASTSEVNAKASEVAAKDSETKAKTSETNAKASEDAAKDSEENALASEQAAGTYKTQAATSAEEAADSAAEALASQNAAKASEEKVLEVEAELAGTLSMQGTVTFEDLPSLSSIKNGWMYNVSDEFTTTDQFKEGSGHTIAAGSNVYKTADGFWDVLAGNFVSKVNGKTGNIEITPENIMAFPGSINITNNTNLNTLTTPGIYYKLGGVTVTNLPDGVPLTSGLALMVIKNGGSPITQILIESAGTKDNIFLRKTEANLFLPWRQLPVGIKGDMETEYRGGSVNITPYNIGAVPWYSSTIINANTDWNNIIEVGCHKVQNATMDDAHHAPVGMYPFGALIVFWAESDSGEARKVQMYIPNSSEGIKHAMCFRSINSGSWYPWAIIYDSSQNDAAYIKKTGDIITGELKNTGGNFIVQKTDAGYYANSDDGSRSIWLGTQSENRGLWDKEINKYFLSLTNEDNSLILNSGRYIKTYKPVVFTRSTGIGSFSGAAGTNGWVVMAQIKINGTYVNHTLELIVGGRGRGIPTHLHIMFASSNTLDPDLTGFNAYGGDDISIFRIKKVAASTWQIAVKKNEAYGSIYLMSCNTAIDFISDNSLIITYPNTMLSTEPDSTWTAPTWGGKIKESDYARVSKDVEHFKVTNTTSLNPGDELYAAIGYASGVPGGTFGPGSEYIVDSAIIKQRYSDKFEVRIYQDYRTGRLAVKGKNNGVWQDTRLIPYSDLEENMSLRGTLVSEGLIVGDSENDGEKGMYFTIDGIATRNKGGATSYQKNILKLNDLAMTQIGSLRANGNRMSWNTMTSHIQDARPNILLYAKNDTSLDWAGIGVETNDKSIIMRVGSTADDIGEFSIQRGNNNVNAGFRMCDRSKNTYFNFTAEDGYIGVFHGFGLEVRNFQNNFVPVKASAFTVSSSLRYKENIEDMTEEEAKKILKIRVVSFDYKEEYGGEKKQFGVIAEETEKYIQFVVKKDTEGNTDSIDYSKFSSYLIKMEQIHEKKLKEHNQEIQKLKEENTILKAELAELRAAVQTLLSK